jgi:predicted acetyltransferase
MGFSIRRFDEDEFEAVAAVQGEGFGFDAVADELEVYRKLIEFDRTSAAVDGERIVGTAGSVSFELTMPGGLAVPVAGLTAVSVLPTHRRRGILTSMIEHQTRDSIERGESMSILWASEAAIYQRFGYGPATYSAWMRTEAPATFRFGAVPGAGTVELIDRDDIVELARPIHDRHRLAQPGNVGLPQAWWDTWTTEVEHMRGGATKTRYAIHRGSSGPDGYMRFRRKNQWENGLPRGEVIISDLVAESPGAYAALWDFAFSMDLVRTVTANNRSRDEAITRMVGDPRRIVTTVGDGIWLRVIDPIAALSGRRYSVPGVVRLGLNGNEGLGIDGVYEVEASDTTATARKIDARPDIEMDVSVLGACMLGEHSFTMYARAGRVTGDPASLALADRMFATSVAPHCPTKF